MPLLDVGIGEETSRLSDADLSFHAEHAHIVVVRVLIGDLDCDRKLSLIDCSNAEGM